jgi:hypothetical protein
VAGDRRPSAIALAAALCLTAPACGPGPAPPGLSPDPALSFATLAGDTELEVLLSGFSAGIERFGPTGPLRLPTRGPYP